MDGAAPPHTHTHTHTHSDTHTHNTHTLRTHIHTAVRSVHSYNYMPSPLSRRGLVFVTRVADGDGGGPKQRECTRAARAVDRGDSRSSPAVKGGADPIKSPDILLFRGVWGGYVHPRGREEA